MRPLPRAPLLLVVAAFAVSHLAAQNAGPPPSPATPAAITPAPERPRPFSPGIAAKLAEQMPKFVPPQPAAASPADATAAAPPPDLRELDQPKNTIVRLPSYLVQDEKPPVFKERHLLTPKGRLALGFKLYPGLRFGSLPFFGNDGWALAMLKEDHRLERQAEMTDLVTLVTAPADRAKAKAEVQKAFLRSDW